jgi:Family of unknown function (DUF5681)
VPLPKTYPKAVSQGTRRTPRRQRHYADGRFAPVKRTARDSIEVGYGSPPQANQFKPGQSGNPRGRPKGAKNEATILRELLNRKIQIREAGRTRKITVLEAILLRFTEDALKGNTKSAAFLFNRYAGAQLDDSHPIEEVNDDDRKVLDAFIRRIGAQHRKADRS